MSLTALTVFLLVAFLRGLGAGRHTHRRRRIFRNRHGVFFRGIYRLPFFHPRRRSARRCRRRNRNGRRGRNMADRRRNSEILNRLRQYGPRPD